MPRKKRLSLRDAIMTAATEAGNAPDDAWWRLFGMSLCLNGFRIVHKDDVPVTMREAQRVFVSVIDEMMVEGKKLAREERVMRRRARFRVVK